MKYLKVFTDFSCSIEMLGDAEIGRLFKAMLKYAESGEESNLNGNERFVWGTAKLIIDREADFIEKQRQNGLKKSQTKPTEAKKAKPSQISQKDNDNDKEKTKTNITPVIPFTGELGTAVSDWLSYKQEKRQGYKPTGLKSLFTQIKNAADTYGDEAVIKVIRDSMSSNYQGIMFDRLKKPKANAAPACTYTNVRDDSDLLARLLKEA